MSKSEPVLVRLMRPVTPFCYVSCVEPSGFVSFHLRRYAVQFPSRSAAKEAIRAAKYRPSSFNYIPASVAA